ncbi:PVC-type heme-binding CxxCH protein [Luteolibacter sp. LG18]|uniref:PVC-type heme-binding CxxCH protein n=1 Tax=Luteolibacter sp. LG18 TaxID=2819286 RepID=UPI002B31AD51|nr:hypothetical protein llg_30700 [Luteolibacter sp. LG18]
MKAAFIFTSFLLIARMASAAPAGVVMPQENARRLEVLFFGAPTANGPHHDPIERYREAKKHLGVSGINLSYSESLADLNPSELNRYDAVLLYGNWPKVTGDQQKAITSLVEYVEAGHGFLPIHCASACFENSDAYLGLVGGHFKSHGTGVFKTTIVDANHPVMRGFEGFETWDETYVHDKLTNDRTLLQKREEEPWSWTRNQGKGRVFYTAYGHDMRCWSQPAFEDLLRRGIMWAVGDSVRAKVLALKLPALETEEVQLPGYRNHQMITRAQKPLPPAESIKLAQVPQGFEISLFASEPDIVNPINVAWDEKGRAYVVQTVDYPNNIQTNDLGHDSIKICEDTNGDGKADKFTVFADKLSLPTSLVCANGGVICTNGTEMLFLQDTNGDGKADVRKVLFSGFKVHDTHAGVSNLRYGSDNWIYATIGYAGFDGTVGGEHHSFNQVVFRFKPDASKLEVLQSTTNNTWGLGFTSDFDVLGSTANGNPSWFYTFSKAQYAAVNLPQSKTPAGDNNPMFFPSSLDIRQVDQFDRYTAGAGHGFVTSTRMPESYKDRIAFVCEPTGKLVGEFDVTRNGAKFISKQLPNNLFSSADAWSSPVCAEEGPDGAVWVCDWYNLIIQHNPTPSVKSAGLEAKTGRGNAYESPIRDRHAGRIYRVYPKGSANEANPKLDIKNPASLAAGLKHPNLFWRLQSQRLIVENKLTSMAASLKEFVSSGQPGAVQAFNSLAGLGLVDAELIKTALSSKDRGLRRAALQAAPAGDSTVADVVIQDGLVKASDGRELAETLVALGNSAQSEKTGKAILATLKAQQDQFSKDSVLRDAWQIGARLQASGVLVAAATELPVGEKKQEAAPAPNLISNADFSQKAGDQPTGWTLRSYVTDRPDSVKMTVSDGGRSGGTCLKIESSARADVGAGIEVNVKPNTHYRLSGWIKTQNLENKGGRGAMMNVHGMDASTQAVTGTKDWTQVQSEFDTGDQSQILIHCLFGGYGGSTGTAYWDDVSLVETGSAGTKDDLTGWVTPVATFLAAKGTPAQKQAAVDALNRRGDETGKALVAAIGTAPVAEVAKVKKFKPDAEVHKRGAEVFSMICIACHGPDGKGVPETFPPLDGSDWLTGDPGIPINIVLNGLQGPIQVGEHKFNNIMAPLSNLNDQQISDVLTYVRQSWDNDAAAVDVATVTKARAANKRTTMWTAGELRK